MLEFYADVIGKDPKPIAPKNPSALPEFQLLAYETSALGSPWTVVTCGMSATRMNVPHEAIDRAPRAELICYLPSIEHEYTWWLRWIAEFPFIDQTWVGYGHTIYSAAPLFENSELRHFLLLPSLVRRHRDMGSRVQIAGDRVDLWWVVPITDAEREFKMTQGVDALLELFDKRGLPLVLDPKRHSVV